MNSLRINSNIPAMNTHRSVYNNSLSTARSMEKISSGLKVNRGADGPAELVVSEILRGQIAGITQAISNNEISINMAQTAEDAMNEVNLLLVRMKQLSIHASNEGANDIEMLEADQAEFNSAMDTLDRIAEYTTFGSKKLLDGTNASKGMAVGKGLSFIEGGIKSISSSDSRGFDVKILNEATKSTLIGEDEFSEDVIALGETLKLYENGKSIELTTKEGDTLEGVIASLNHKLENQNMNLVVTVSDNDKLIVTHKEFGSAHEFTASSTTEGIFSNEDGEIVKIANGRDVSGYIDEHQVDGEGEYLTGKKGTLIDGLKLKYSHVGDPIDELTSVGSVSFAQNSLRFQVGETYGATLNFGLPSTYAESLGRNVANESGYENMRDVNLRNFQGAQDALKLIEQSQNEITGYRAELGAIQRNGLEVNNRYLRTAQENMTGAESVIRDTDMAAELTRYAKEKIKLETSMSMLANANKNPRDIMALLQ